MDGQLRVPFDGPKKLADGSVVEIDAPDRLGDWQTKTLLLNELPLLLDEAVMLDVEFPPERGEPSCVQKLGTHFQPALQLLIGKTGARSELVMETYRKLASCARPETSAFVAVVLG